MIKLLLGAFVVAATFLAFPGAAIARTDTVRAWITTYQCGNGYVDLPVTVINDGPMRATYRISLSPGNWGTQDITLAGGSQKPLPRPFRVMANGVNKIVLDNIATGTRTQIAIKGGAINCTSMANKTVRPPVKKQYTPSPSPKQSPATTGLGASAQKPQTQSSGQHWLFWVGIFGLLGVAFLSASYEMWRRWPQA